MLLNNGQVIDLAPQGLAELVPQLTTSYYYPDGIGLELERNFALYGELYRQQPWVRAVVDKRADAVARLPIVVWNEAGQSRQEDTSSGYAKLIAKPCAYLDQYTFWAWVCSTIDIYGETYLAITRDDDGKPMGLLPMHPTRVAIKRAPETGRYIYTFQSGAGAGDGLVQFDETDVVPFKRFNPLKLERGLSKLESLRSTLMAEDSSRNAISAIWRNAGMPNMVLNSDKRLSDDAKKRLRESFQAVHSGSSNTGQTLVLEEGLTAQALQLNPDQMQTLEMRKLNREEVCGVYAMPPASVQILDHSTFSNVAAQLRGLYRESMAPFIEFIESVLDFYLGGNWTGSRSARFAVDEVIRGDYETRMEAGARAVMTAGMTPNEYRELIGLDRHKDPKADRLFANAAIQPLGTPAERITLTGAVGHDPDGVALQPGAPGATSVPALNGSGGSDVPQMTSSPTSPSDMDASVTALEYRPKHLRAIKGALGRGQQIGEAAKQLAERFPDELDDILLAVKAAIAERDGFRK